MKRMASALMGVFAALSWAGSASALSLLEVQPGGTNDQVLSLDAYTRITPADLVGVSLLGSTGGGSFTGCTNNTSCTIDLTGAGAKYVTVKANGYEALYQVDPGDTLVRIVVSSWDDDLTVPGASTFAQSWPNAGGNYPGISNIRSWGGAAPVPEPSAALLFAVGSAVVGSTIRRRA